MSYTILYLHHTSHVSSSPPWPVVALSHPVKLCTAEAQHGVCYPLNRMTDCYTCTTTLYGCMGVFVFEWRKKRSWSGCFRVRLCFLSDEGWESGKFLIMCQIRHKCFCVSVHLRCLMGISSKLLRRHLNVFFLTTLQACGCFLLRLLFRYTVHLYIWVCIHTLIY